VAGVATVVRAGIRVELLCPGAACGRHGRRCPAGMIFDEDIHL
jgi:hypothetical protein